MVKETERNDFLKFLACVLMLVDHVGYIFFPGLIFMRAIGRLAFPIFAWQAAKGYEKTSNLKKYMQRLFVFAIVSQIPYIWFSPGKLNIIPTILVGLWVIWLHENGGRYGFLLAALLASTGDIVNLQYGSYGLMMIWIFHIFKRDKGFTTLAYAGMSVFFAWISGWSFSMVFQSLSIFALFLIFADWKIQLHMNRYFFYVFYPCHIIVILLVKSLI
ncbi:MAG TPA: TraX family protein [Clostridia bacterium]|nr:TraX family protein [Clostridia bacterium]